tara:strand:- start:44 stop:412 length:369 start_codon:yes stop_codon:yes gene_type:complete
MDLNFRWQQPDGLNGLDIIDEFGSFTLSTRHIGKWVRQNSASATTVTVPLMLGLRPGASVVIEAYGAGTVTIAGVAGIAGPPVLHPRGTYATSIVSAGQYAPATLFYEGGQVWNVSGDVTVT